MIGEEPRPEGASSTLDDVVRTQTGPLPLVPGFEGRRVILADGRPTQRARRLSRRQIVTRFIAASVAGLVLLVALGALLAYTAARLEALAEARREANFVVDHAITGHIPDSILTQDPKAVAAFDALVRKEVLPDGVVRVKLWRPDGTIVYSDEKRLRGKRYALGEEERKALSSRGVFAETSTLKDEENQYERGFGQLLAVYRPVWTADGSVLLYEQYSRYDEVQQRTREVFRKFAPVTLSTAVLLALVQWPLMRWMLRQLEGLRAERERLLENSLAATDEERRRIVGNLHDGIVQDLTGASLLVTNSAGAARRSGNPELAEELTEAAVTVREGLRGLRSALVEIYPPGLRGAGLAEALGDLVAPLRNRGVQVLLDVPPDFEASAPVETLLYRVAQEAVRNAGKHAAAGTLRVHLVPGRNRVTLWVSDDGRGFDPVIATYEDGSVRPTQREDGTHVGLSLLSDLASNAGAQLELISAPGAGTTVKVEVPLS
jgi:two-component system, NarL family, sensor kinase